MFDKAREIQRRHLTNGEGGFTLIELLIVIVVLGILAAIVVFALGGVTGQSAISACTSDAKTVSIAVSAFEAQTGATTLTAPTVTTTSTGTVVTDPQLVPTYLKSWPSNPSYYQITVATTGAVEVALNTGDTGATNITGTAFATNYTAAVPFEADSANTQFTYATNLTNGLQGQGVCQGA